MRKDNEDYTFISLEITKEQLQEIMRTMNARNITSRSDLIRQLLTKWMIEDGDE